MRNGFTLLELIVVIIIVGVLATMGISQYSAARENALKNEARASLLLILAAERVTRMERDDGQYVVCADNSAVNTNLHLLLPTAATRSWNYSVTTYTSGTDFCAQASRNSATIVKNFRIRAPSTLAGRTLDPQPEEDATCP